MKFFKLCLIAVVSYTLQSCTDGPQQADPDFTPQNTQQRFDEENSPAVLVDQAHHNFLTINGRYRPFFQVLESDGYTVKANNKRFTLNNLKNTNILVIANALDRDRQDWSPPYTQALSEEEVTSVTQWVSKGGSLMIIADHAPFPKVIESLINEFGFQFSNGHVDSALFKADNGSLGQHAITSGDSIKQVKTFGGSAFKAPVTATSLLTLGEGVISLEPKVPFKIDSNTVRRSMQGWSQGAVLEFGKGRVAVFSEGMTFSSQLDVRTGNVYGFRSRGAEQNERFLLNTMAWLAGTL